MSQRITTYQYRLKDGNQRHRKALRQMSRSINYSWNFANATTQKAWKRDRKWLTSAEVDKLFTGSSKLLGLHSQTLQAISQEHANKRNDHSKCTLCWRSKKKHTDWIPFKASGVKVECDTVTYQGITFRFWKSREFPKGAMLKLPRFLYARGFGSKACEK